MHSDYAQGSDWANNDANWRATEDLKEEISKLQTEIVKLKDRLYVMESNANPNSNLASPGHVIDDKYCR